MVISVQGQMMMTMRSMHVIITPLFIRQCCSKNRYCLQSGLDNILRKTITGDVNTFQRDPLLSFLFKGYVANFHLPLARSPFITEVHIHITKMFCLFVHFHFENICSCLNNSSDWSLLDSKCGNNRKIMSHCVAC